jgi:hypothetical protein
MEPIRLGPDKASITVRKGEHDISIKACNANTYQKGIDFGSTPLHAIFVLHDTHDWGRDTQIITELLSSRGGVMGTQRDDRTKQKEGGEIPLLFSNPDLEWRS